MILRDYQERMLEQARAAMRRGVRTLLVQAPTGSGKTVLTARMISTAASRGMTSWFLVHRRELLAQASATFSAFGIDHGCVTAGRCTDARQRILIGSVQTVSRRLGGMPPPRFIVFDEAHHVAAGSWSKIHEAYEGAYRLGLTATPQRLDGKGLSRWFEHMVEGPRVAELIRDGYLSAFKLYAPATIDVSGVRSRMGDFDRSGLEAAAVVPSVTGDAVKEYAARAAGRPFIVFCVSIRHAELVAQAFCTAGVSCSHVSGKTPAGERQLAMERFRRGEIRGLSSCDLFSEGLDVAGIECAILLRPTQSLAMYLQQVGRALRPSSAPAIILDHAGNCMRHGLPDEPHTWSLADRPSRGARAPQAVTVKICERCFAAQRVGSTHCRFCEAAFPVTARKVRQRAGTLVEITEARREQRTERAQASTLEELVALGVRRGYRNARAWAYYVYSSRRKRQRACAKPT